jgi:3-hydroxy-9,10-secoandrosta-1,3,5(10)-triene-9,17-dione monooxygenase
MTNVQTDTKDLRVELVERVHSIGPVLAAGVAEGDRERRLSEDTVRAIDSAQLSRLWTARAYGGLETDVRTLSEVTKTLSHYCPSTSWVVNNINGSNLMASRFPLETRDEVFGANPGAKLASIFVAAGNAVRTDGGYLLTGKWPYGSGILHDDWAILMAKEVDAEGETVRRVSVLVPTADLTVEDTWFTVGMRGTGSRTAVANKAFVPEHRVIPIETQLGRQNATDPTLPPLLRSPAVAAMAVICASVVIGIGKAARAVVVDRAPERGIAPTIYNSQPKSRTFVSALGKTALTIDAAEMHINRAADVIDQAAAEAFALPESELRRIRGDVGQSVNLITIALDELMWLHGASSFAEANPLQQFWRDANTAARHAMLNVHAGYELYGGSFFGLDSIVPSL